MPDIEVVDLTGALPSLKDVERAITAVKGAAVRDILTLPPDLAIEVANIIRCLALAKHVLKRKAELEGKDG